MNEGNPVTVQMDSESVSEDFDNGTSLKGADGEEGIKPLQSKSDADLSGSESVVESNALSTNGIESQPIETQPESEEDKFACETKSDVKTVELNENATSEEPGGSSENLVSDDEIKKEICDVSNQNDNNERDFEVEETNNVSEKSPGVEQSTEEDVTEQINVSSSENNVGEETENGGVQEGSCKSDLNENNESSEISSPPPEKKEVIDNSNEEIQNVCTNVEDVTISSNSELKTEIEEKHDDDDDVLENRNSNESTEDVDLPPSSPMDVDSETCTETNDPEKDTKSEDVSQNDSSQNESEQSKVPDADNNAMDVDNDNQDVDNKNDCVQDIISHQNNVSLSNTSGEQDEELACRSENDGNEMMDTEVVNCNEIEQIDLSESESVKDKEIDRIRIEPNEGDLRCDQKDEEMVTDSLETNEKFIDPEERNEALDNVISIEEDTHNQPGNSEEETITGDTNSQSSTSLTKDKDEEICIIPDDMTPRLSLLSKSEQSKSGEGENENKSEGKVIRVSSLELETSRSEGDDKKGESDDKQKERPRRSAAKLADNKIKSLVQNDVGYEESSPGSERDIQEDVSETMRMCTQCREEKICKYVTAHNNSTHYLCSKECCNAYVNSRNNPGDGEHEELDSETGEYPRKCGECRSKIVIDDKCLFWETMDFCNEDCLGKYQTKLGSNCANCKDYVVATSLGKYCVRFGYDVKQFCCSACLEEYKKGLKVCSYCQKDISTGAEGFLAPVGDKGQFKDFCTQSCMEKYERMSSNAPPPDVIEECAVCSNSKPVRVEVELDNKTHKLCSEPCFAAFKFVNNIREGQCNMCKKYFDRLKTGRFLLFYEETPHTFCCKTCMNVYILANRKVVPCNWCKVKKYNFDMIKKVSGGQLIMMCSLHCLMLYQVSVNSSSSRRVKCDFCMAFSQAQYHLTMSDGSIRNFCCYNCVMAFQNQYPKQTLELMSESEQLTTPIPTGTPKRTTSTQPPCVPVISSVQSLASPNRPSSPTGRVQIPRQDVSQASLPQSVVPMPAPPPPQIYQQIITKPPPAKQMKNKSILCKPYSHTKGVSCRPHPCMKETQTDESLNRKFLIPIPVPIYVPAPMFMFSAPFPVPVPFPLPVPVPIFIPTTRNSAKGIFKEIKKIQEKIPTDPFEAELLMMAEMVAGDKKQDPTDSESEDGNDGDDGGDGTFSPENVDTSNTFGDDMLQMALKMASELEEPAVDMESVLTPNTITTTAPSAVDSNKTHYASDPDDPDQVNVMSMNRGRKRSGRGSRNSSGGTPSKRGRRTSGYIEAPLLPPPENVPPPRIEVEKPDANMCLKYTFGVNAWRHWVMQKNAELEKVALTNRKIKLFKPELLQLTADELNFSLCLFVKEVRKPNGTEYAPDTIYYLCLGIQQYLFENGRIDNIFTDSYYEKFTDCLDEVAKKFAALYSDSQYIVTRVEEEHLWESKQLGAHSPHVLLSTLMFFNTKHFNLVTVEEHMQLSFSHIMKHWKRNPNTPGVAKVPGSRNVLLRFYPPQSALEANSRKKKVYEQQENEENPLRCPVKLYEFYLSKCPESVKTRNDVFYLLPERSCVPDSPVWYSTMALGKEPLMKMLHRVKMVKEINIALLSS